MFIKAYSLNAVWSFGAEICLKNPLKSLLPNHVSENFGRCAVWPKPKKGVEDIRDILYVATDMILDRNVLPHAARCDLLL